MKTRVRSYFLFMMILLGVTGCGKSRETLVSEMPKPQVEENLGKQLSDTPTENATPLKKYSFSSEEDLIELPDEDVIYLVTHDYKTTDFIDDLKAEPYDDFGTPLGTYERFEPVLLNPGGERPDYDVNKSISDEEFKKMTEDYMADFKENSNNMTVIYCGETGHYMEYGYKTPNEFGSGRICFYRNKYMMSEILDGHSYAGPVYLGELTVDNVLSEEDFYMTCFDDICLMMRNVEDRKDAVVYVCYYPSLRQFGENDERGQNQKAELIKEEAFYDKETHRITQEQTVLRSVDIPDTVLYIPEPE